jgi:hypothetical protein
MTEIHLPGSAAPNQTLVREVVVRNKEAGEFSLKLREAIVDTLSQPYLNTKWSICINLGAQKSLHDIAHWRHWRWPLTQMPFSDLWWFPVVIPYARAIGTFSVSI